MSYFPATIAAYLAGRVVRFSYLLELQFDPVPAYFHPGVGTIMADGKSFLGLGQFLRMEGLEEALQHQSIQLRFTLSGAIVSSELMQLVIAGERSAYFGKMALLWLQFFDEDWALLDSPFAFMANLIDGMELTRDQADDTSIVRAITLTAENIFYNRRVATSGYYTDADQQFRFPGDLGLEFIPSILDKTIPVPW